MARHNVTSGLPVTAGVPRIVADKLAFAKSEFDTLIANSIVHFSHSPWSSPLHMVLVKMESVGNHMATIVYSTQQPVPVVTRYPTYTISRHHFKARLCFQKIDLVRAYHQIPVVTEGLQKSAVTVPFGLFELLRTPFGYCNAAWTFQRFIDSITRDFDFIHVYMNDLFINYITKRR